MSEGKKLSKAELRQKRLDELEQNEKKKKLILVAVVGVLIVIFLGGIAWGLNNILNTEGTMDNPNDTVLISAPVTPQQGIETLKSITAFASNPENISKVKLKVSTAVSVDNDSITDNSEDGKLVEVLKYIKADMLGVVSENYGKYEGIYGVDSTKELLPNSFTVNDIKSFECTGEEDNTNRELHFIFTEAEYPQKAGSLLYENFGMEKCSDTETAVTELLSSIAQIKEKSLKCVDFEIIASYNAEEMRADSIKYLRKYQVNAKVNFTGELAQLGEREIGFVFTAEEKYDFTYAGLKLNAHKMWLKKGETDNLEAIRTYDPEMLDEQGKEAAKVIWSSSDPEIATVDDEGYIKGKKVSDKPVTVTAKYTFLGNVYEDTCEVYVRVPLTEIKVREKEIELNVGETKTVSVNCKPENATFKTVDWFSSDESIATVDKDGVITAKSVGEVDIFAIAHDGNFKSTCKITVKDGADNG